MSGRGGSPAGDRHAAKGNAARARLPHLEQVLLQIDILGAHLFVRMHAGGDDVSWWHGDVSSGSSTTFRNYNGSRFDWFTASKCANVRRRLRESRMGCRWNWKDVQAAGAHGPDQKLAVRQLRRSDWLLRIRSRKLDQGHFACLAGWK